ncbi:stage V sporulation protein AA [Tepidibacter aestuarii]|uniref:stage V sporulation protein AA n=1 Tax=Tepidibacter aestuarii TaxID=2925782 RepID=UPI0020BEA09E|nr:stage V sporulation protein AA [Tepidibacter aestuarii]CAH2212448.1 stage V sporulation protein AA [Tepidibacter aestuarii]
MEIYLKPKKHLKFKKDIKDLYLKDLFHIYPSQNEDLVKDIIVAHVNGVSKDYEVIELGDVISRINSQNSYVKVNFLELNDLLIHFDNPKKDNMLFIRVLFVCIVLFLGSGMAIINFHSDVNMNTSQKTILRILTGSETENLLLFQIAYSLGIGAGVAVFYNKVIPNFSKSEPSPLELEVSTFKNEVQTYIIENNEK